MHTAWELHTTSSAVGDLIAQVGVLACSDVFESPESMVGDTIIEVERLRALLDAFQSGLIGRFDAAFVSRGDGALTTKSWLCQNVQMSWQTAACRINVARALLELDEVRDLARAGDRP